jgi:hypothetical protein
LARLQLSQLSKKLDAVEPPKSDPGGRTKFSPREIAEMWGVGRERILTLIRNGDLPAINVAIKPFGRPRFLVSLEDIKKFESRRMVLSQRSVIRRRPRRMWSAELKQYIGSEI